MAGFSRCQKSKVTLQFKDLSSLVVHKSCKLKSNSGVGWLTITQKSSIVDATKIWWKLLEIDLLVMNLLCPVTTDVQIYNLSGRTKNEKISFTSRKIKKNNEIISKAGIEYSLCRIQEKSQLTKKYLGKNSYPWALFWQNCSKKTAPDQLFLLFFAGVQETSVNSIVFIHVHTFQGAKKIQFFFEFYTYPTNDRLED